MTFVERVGRVGGQKEVINEDAKEEVKQPYQPLRVLGGIREKGFDGHGGAGGKPGRVSLPQPSVRPFPIARHRSEGPVSSTSPLED